MCISSPSKILITPLGNTSPHSVALRVGRQNALWLTVPSCSCSHEYLYVCLSLYQSKDLRGRLGGLQSLSDFLLSSLRYVGPAIILGVVVGPEPLPRRVFLLPSPALHPFFFVTLTGAKPASFQCPGCFILPFPSRSEFHNVEGSMIDLSLC